MRAAAGNRSRHIREGADPTVEEEKQESGRRLKVYQGQKLLDRGCCDSDQLQLLPEALP
jgi:hypothetical protein